MSLKSKLAGLVLVIVAPVITMNQPALSKTLDGLVRWLMQPPDQGDAFCRPYEAQGCFTVKTLLQDFETPVLGQAKYPEGRELFVAGQWELGQCYGLGKLATENPYPCLKLRSPKKWGFRPGQVVCPLTNEEVQRELANVPVKTIVVEATFDRFEPEVKVVRLRNCKPIVG
jgi:hypothetical protein